nr:MAG TPA: hypothetical protein [Caudoviricetes sp.]
MEPSPASCSRSGHNKRPAPEGGPCAIEFGHEKTTAREVVA